MAELEGKRVFLIASNSSGEAQGLSEMVEKHIKGATIFRANDGTEALFKTQNVTPHVVILDSDLLKMTAFDVAESLLLRKEKIAIIIVSPLLDAERFVDEVATGQVHILTRPIDQMMFLQHLNRALNWITNGDITSYRLRFFSENEMLIREGDAAKSVFLVKSGRLKAYTKEGPEEVVLGHIKAGEFVGEMAYIHSEQRSANVVCLTECELIEIPNECLDSVLFLKPSWSKALVKTLSSRLKKANTEKAGDSPESI